MQVKFRCRSCGLRGWTPEVTREEAVRLSAADLRLRCPKCGAILVILTSGLEDWTLGETAVGATVYQAIKELLDLHRGSGDE